MGSDYIKRVWAEVDLDAAAHNYMEIRKRLNPGVKMCCVVKADAYGHGAAMLAREYEALGAEWLAVSNLEEAEELRQAGIRLPVLILGYTPPELAQRLCSGNFSQAILSLEYARRLSAVAVRGGYTVKGHLAVDTGMSRIGFVYQDKERDKAGIEEMYQACCLSGIIPEGIFTHFSAADGGESGSYFTAQQFRCFIHAISLLEQRGVTFRLRHCANSAALLDYPEYQLDMVRPGIILYGLHPSAQVNALPPLRPVMQLKSVLSLVKRVEEGASVSYGRCFTAEKPTLVGTIPAGYADGYFRLLDKSGYVTVRGKKAGLVGRVCMDQFMVELGQCPEAEAGDEVVLFGEEPLADALAESVGTIGYELVCSISRRVPRVYLRHGRQEAVLNRMR